MARINYMKMHLMKLIVREKSDKYHLMPCLEEQTVCPLFEKREKERFYDILLVFKKYSSESGGGSTYL